MEHLPLWAGVECTVNRVGDRYFDQSILNGHERRIEDLDLIAGLGVRALRYPVLWERVAPDGIAAADWRWTDERLQRLQELGIDPIVTLLHHGSGPRDTHLLDRAFPRKLAAYAFAVARRYPWLSSYTPVNEPLTTARFSALYGHWYPHERSDAAFVRALLNQCRGTVLAMQAIRRVNPSARLVQTDDLGKTHSTMRLAYQRDWENERRWLTWDLLCGRVGPKHAMWSYLRAHGAAAAELRWFEAHTCPPDVIGLNHYVTSERYLDERVEAYPAWSHGGNGVHAYADVEAVRAHEAAPVSWAGILSETWERYRLPIAITEAHLGGGREDQVRWLLCAWDAAHEVRAAGADVRAVTAWSLFGCTGWNQLCTEGDGLYEPGVFDARADPPRPTALAAAMRELARGLRPSHAVLDAPGWWERADGRMYGRPEEGQRAA